METVPHPRYPLAMAESGIYEAYADDYAVHSEQSSFNAHYERPALIGLLPAVDGRTVLDVGCGAGPMSERLESLGARVTGLDLSRPLLERARRRCPDAEFIEHDLAEPLPFGSGSFHCVVASLCLHYVRDWEPVLAEFFRVLEPGGCVVLSTSHPAGDWARHPTGRYFETREIEETWDIAGRSIDVRFYRRPLSSSVSSFLAAGFVLEVLHEAQPTESCEAVSTEDYAMLMRDPHFILFRLRKP